MFVGHYAFSYILKKNCQQIPVWWLFLCVQLVDILAFFFVLIGIERISYQPSPNPFLRTHIEHVPITHSLAGNAVIAGIVFLIAWKLKGRVWAIVLSIAVLSHWFIDVLVHTPDMSLFFGHYKVGLGLWRMPWLTFLLELGFLVLAGYYLLRNAEKIKRTVVVIALLLISFAGMFFAPEGEVSTTVAAAMSLFLYALFTGMAYWAEVSGGAPKS